MKSKKFLFYIVSLVALVVLFIYFRNPGNNKTAENITKQASTNKTLNTEEVKKQLPYVELNNTSISSTVNDKIINTTNITLYNTKFNTIGNTSGNLAQQGGSMASQGKWMYFSMPAMSSNNLCRSLLDMETGYKQLSENPINNLNVIGEWIYFFDYNSLGIYKIKTDGSEKTLMIPNTASPSFIAVDNIIYFDSYEGLSKIDVLENKITQISPVHAMGPIYYDNNNIYYIKEPTENSEKDKEQMSLFRVSTDGKTVKQLAKDKCVTFIIDGDWIYYKDYANKLYKINKDGANKTSLVDEEINAFNASNKIIYYNPLNDVCNVYSINMDGKNKTKLTDKTIFNALEARSETYIPPSDFSAVSSIFIIDEYLYCPTYSSPESFILRMKKDGTLQKNIYY